jgi:5-dehydro-2-deoxygluconokinase
LTQIDRDIVTIGRASVDLYGQQIGGRLEDMGSFAKSVGGCPANIAIGASRLGLKAGLITRVGDEHMGRFIREQLTREGVDTSHVRTDPERLTALVILGVRDDKTFPLIFYRENCADWAIDESDIDENYIARSGAIVVTGTHFSRAQTAAAQKKAMALAKKHGRRIAFDIDYRPNLWGLAGHGAGEERYIKSDEVTRHLAPILPDCDLIVGTEEELAIAGGFEDTLASIRAIRAVSQATIVCKRGPMGCVVFPGAIPDRLEEGIRGPGFPVEVFNVLGAGDAFMAGFLRGWMRDEPLETCCKWANAGGAFAVSRLLCSPEYPTKTELDYFLAHGASEPALRKDKELAHVHWATTRRPSPDTLMALAIDHRSQLEAIADEQGASRDRIPAFKKLALEACLRVAKDQPGYGMLLDGTYGQQALFAAASHPLWIGRPVELPGSRPLKFEGGGDIGTKLIEWPVDHVIKCLCFYRMDDSAQLKAEQEERMLQLQDAARRLGREWLLEIIASKHGTLEDDTISSILNHLYDLGLKPDWWKLESQPSAKAYANITSIIRSGDPFCRGIVLLGLDAPEAELAKAFALAAPEPLVKGFAIGRTIFAEPARLWLGGKISDDDAISHMEHTFARLTTSWTKARSTAGRNA